MSMSTNYLFIYELLNIVVFYIDRQIDLWNNICIQSNCFATVDEIKCVMMNNHFHWIGVKSRKKTNLPKYIIVCDLSWTF